MFKIRKAKIKHNCYICNSEIKPKKHYINFNKQNSDSTYTNAAICEKCLEKMLIKAIDDE